MKPGLTFGNHKYYLHTPGHELRKPVEQNKYKRPLTTLEKFQDCLPTIKRRTTLEVWLRQGEYALKKEQSAHQEKAQVPGAQTTQAANLAFENPEEEWRQLQIGLVNGLNGQLPDQQNLEAAEHLYQTIKQRYPEATSVNLLSVYTGEGKSECYFVSHLKKKGIKVQNMLAIDTLYSNEIPPFIDRLENAKLIERGSGFSTANECCKWREDYRFPIHAIVSVHRQDAFWFDPNKKNLIKSLEEYIHHVIGLSILFNEVDSDGAAIPYMEFRRGTGDNGLEIEECNASDRVTHYEELVYQACRRTGKANELSQEDTKNQNPQFNDNQIEQILRA
jgi:hypothetical protein